MMIINDGSHPAIVAPGACIEFLPAEILLTIFKIVFVNTRTPIQPRPCAHEDCGKEWSQCICDTTPFETEWSNEEDVVSPTTFPYGLSSVCTRWRKVASLEPQFWTRVVFHVDSDCFARAFAFFCEELQWSHDLPIDITVVSKTKRLIDTPKLEKSRMWQVIPIIAAHTPRCTSLCFDLFYTTSLPSLCRDFYGLCPRLKKLVLRAIVANGPGGIEAREDSGTGNHWNGNDAHKKGSDVGGSKDKNTGERDLSNELFEFPAVKHLELDGWNFSEICEATKDDLSCTGCTHVSLAHYIESSGAQGRFSMIRCLTALAHLDDIYEAKFMGLGYHCEIAHALELPVSNQLKVANLKLENLSGPLIAFILMHCDPGTLTITHCPVIRFPQGYSIFCNQIILRDTRVPRAVTSILAVSKCDTLVIINCIGFNDEALSLLGLLSPMTSIYPGRIPGMLVLNACPNFSVASLGMFVWRASSAKITPNTGNRPLSSVSVSSHGGQIPERDRKWFTEKLENFEWITSQ